MQRKNTQGGEDLSGIITPMAVVHPPPDRQKIAKKNTLSSFGELSTDRKRFEEEDSYVPEEGEDDGALEDQKSMPRSRRQRGRREVREAQNGASQG